MLRFLAVDPSPIFLLGLQTRLKQSFKEAQISLCSPESRAWERIGQRDFEVLLWGAEPGREALLPELAHSLPSQGPPVLILSGLVGISWIETCFSLGFKGYVLKDLADRQLKEAVLTLLGGQRFLDCLYRQEVLPFLGDQPCVRIPNPNLLSSKDIEQLRLMACGLSQQEIASALNLTCKTVYRRQAHLRSKLGFEGNHSLIRWANQNLDPFQV